MLKQPTHTDAAWCRVVRKKLGFLWAGGVGPAWLLLPPRANSNFMQKRLHAAVALHRPAAGPGQGWEAEGAEPNPCEALGRFGLRANPRTELEGTFRGCFTHSPQIAREKPAEGI